MTQRSILITGCSSGIGYDAAHGLAKRGWRVFATCRKPEDVDRLAGEGLEALHLDLTDPDSMTTTLGTIQERTGGTLDALFNNGAFGLPGACEDLPTGALREIFETNVFGTHELTLRVIPIMRAQGHGRIVQNSSVLGFTTFKWRAAYVSTKYALEGLTDTLRIEMRDTPIKVVLIEPGPILSKFRENAFRKFQQNINREHSAHRETYRAMEQRLTKKGPASTFTLPPEAVLKKVIHALEAPKPKIRYYVTFPTYLFAGLKRVLPWKWLDWALRQVK